MPTTPGCSSGAERLSAYDVCAGHIQRAELAVSSAGLFWLETDPADGRSRLQCLSGGSITTRATGPAGLGGRLNGYGGGSLTVLGDRVVAVADDQRLLCLRADSPPVEIPAAGSGATWGGLVADPHRERVLAVRELNGRQALLAVYPDGACQSLHQGEDFYGAPALSPDGRRIAWVSWQLPDMPWHRSRLWIGKLDDNGHLEDLCSGAAPTEGAIQQPVFDGERLRVLSDHGGWWQPWRVGTDGENLVWSAVSAPDLDHANAPWQLNERHHSPVGRGQWACVRYRRGVGELWLVAAEGGSGHRLAAGFTDFRSLCVHAGRLYCIARSAGRLDAVIEVNPLDHSVRVLAGGEQPMAAPVLPRPFCVPASGSCELDVHGFLYKPPGPEEAPAPLILMAHGGPTSAAYPVYNAQIQYWCQRGFSVAEVNYRGSSGFGRKFRQALAGRWGESDVDDMERAADYLAGDGRPVYIQGRSSGGYTALMALIDSDRFSGGASLFGVTDPLRLREQTHRFESGYLDWLLGDPDTHPERWYARTPRHHAGRIRVPVIFFQGGQDTVVVPEQTRAMTDAIKAQGGCPELHWFDQEGHGFRDRDNQARMLEWLHHFYRRHSRMANECAENLS
ncbi:prolyl oligopeptidase family serine peptidase [Marinobacter pelagius]|uniref:S9 family peptidase n=1 Tax=Marinobacter sp. C7 TaxID=2951363 RepID=UPI001EF09B73|nr:prolyl oligopeptidase family serine peptidase [Marinobacter sp. C7]MCG7198389.1 prolyl oligopeptidase family serine peptidase [Marinobacter sp. C7]